MNIDRNSQLLALEAFSSDGFIILNKSLIKIFGLDLTVFLCNLIDKYKYFLNRNMLEKDGSFFLTFEDQTEQIGMSRLQLRNNKRKLIEIGILKTHMKGIPAKEFYYLNIENLIEKYVTTRGIENRTPRDIENSTNRPIENSTNNKENKSKENKSKENKKDFSTFSKKIIDLWNDTADKLDLPSVIKLTPSRTNKIKIRIEESPELSKLSGWKKIFDKIADSEFLLGDNDRGWKINFDFIVANDQNYLKILEGKYSNKKKPKSIKGGAAYQEGKYDDNYETVIMKD